VKRGDVGKKGRAEMTIYNIRTDNTVPRINTCNTLHNMYVCIMYIVLVHRGTTCRQIRNEET